jgi:hypothetical protein
MCKLKTYDCTVQNYEQRKSSFNDRAMLHLKSCGIVYIYIYIYIFGMLPIIWIIQVFCKMPRHYANCRLILGNVRL